MHAAFIGQAAPGCPSALCTHVTSRQAAAQHAHGSGSRSQQLRTPHLVCQQAVEVVVVQGHHPLRSEGEREGYRVKWMHPAILRCARNAYDNLAASAQPLPIVRTLQAMQSSDKAIRTSPPPYSNASPCPSAAPTAHTSATCNMVSSHLQAHDLVLAQRGAVGRPQQLGLLHNLLGVAAGGSDGQRQLSIAQSRLPAHCLHGPTLLHHWPGCCRPVC